ncbi:MAG: hypothetical protein GTN76_05545 [Candidatus Aenigmarchaeota archaeon]|nr:hypothetical protein [Candidatus Aenigmarchaeota archaeon]
MRGVALAIIITLALTFVTVSNNDFTDNFLLGVKADGVTGNVVVFAPLSNEWTCASGLTCEGTCEDTQYQRMWEGSPSTKEYSYSFSASPSSGYTCTVKVKTCCFDDDETNEISDIYINDVGVGSTQDECCPEKCGLSAPSRLYALPKGTGKVHLSWRMVSNFPNRGYNVHRSTTSGGPYTKINSNPVIDQTNYIDTSVTNGNTYYYVVRLVDTGGTESENSNEVRVTASDTNDNYYGKFTNFKMQTGADDKDMKVGDIDGDGLFEYLIGASFSYDGDVKVKGPIHIAMHDDDGTRLWGPVNTGVRWAGEYPWTFWDLDEDGKEELIGLMYDESGGDKLYFVIKDGVTGNVLKRSEDIPHQYPQSTSGQDNRLYITIALMDGKNPYIILLNGIYPRNEHWLTAFDRNLNQVWSYYKPKWAHVGSSHKIRSADLDGDGKDEVIDNGMCFNEDGSIRWQRAVGHSDGLHPADIDPDSPGMEILYAIEQGFRTDPYAHAMLLDKDGGVLWYKDDIKSGGGCWAANVKADSPGLECYVKYSTNGWEHRLYSSKGNVLASRGFIRPIDWDGDDVIDFYKPQEVRGGWWYSIHADIIGDYREEKISYNVGEGKLYVFTNNNMNPNGKKPSPWDTHQYALDQRWTGYR